MADNPKIAGIKSREEEMQQEQNIVNAETATSQPSVESGTSPLPKVQGIVNRQAEAGAQAQPQNDKAVPSPPAQNQSTLETSYMDELLKIANAHKPESNEEREARERREKYEGIIAGIGDTVSSFANLYFTTKGSPNAFDPNNSLSKQAIARQDKLRAIREKNDATYLSIMDAVNRLRNSQRDYNFKVEESKRKHEETMAREKRQHEEAMARYVAQEKAAERKEAENNRRHEERMAVKTTTKKTSSGSAKAKEYDMHEVNRYWEGLDAESKRKYVDRNGKVTDEGKKRAWDNRTKQQKPSGSTMPGVRSNTTMPGVK